MKGDSEIEWRLGIPGSSSFHLKLQGLQENQKFVSCYLQRKTLSMVYIRCFFLIRVHTEELLSSLLVTAIIPLQVSYLPGADLQISQDKTKPVWRESTKIFWKCSVTPFIKLLVEVVKEGRREGRWGSGNLLSKHSKCFQSPTAGLQMRRLFLWTCKAIVTV